MKKITILLAALMLLSISSMFAQAPILISPVNGQPDVNPDGIDLVFELPVGAYHIDSFFDVFCDIDPDFSGVPLYSGPLEPIGGQFTCHIDAARPETPFYWFVRYHNLAMGYVTESLVFNFFTTQTTLSCTKIKGNLSSYGGTFGVAGCWFYCPGALYPASYKTQSNGYYDFWVTNGFTYTITHLCPYALYYISPASASVPVPSNQTQDIVQNFYMVCSKPSLSNIVFPVLNMPGVSVILPSLSWSFAQNPDYDPPDRFYISFGPAGSSSPLGEVAYGGEGVYEMPLPPPELPLEYNATYEWKVTPYNPQGGEAEGVETWFFTTEEEPLNPLTLIYPPDGELNLPAEEITLEFEHSDWMVDSFFDVFVDMDPDFPEEPIYSGTLTPISGNLFNFNIGPLMAEQTFYWKVKVTQGLNEWTSAVQQFTTTTYVIPTHSVSGTTYGANGIASGGRKITYYANRGDGYGYVYMGYVNSSLNPPYGYYIIYLPDITNVIYKIVPVKPSAVQYWSPSFDTYTNLTADQTNEHYYLQYYTPNLAVQPIPLNLATGVSVNLNQLQWTYNQDPNYGTPSGFHVYFPADNPIAIEVPYLGRDPEYFADITFMTPLEYDYGYTWKVVPWNEYGEAEDWETWSFETEPYPDPFFPPTLYIYPGDNDSGVEDAGLVMAWGNPEDEKEGFPADSFFDVFMDTDPDFTGLSPIYSGPGLIDPYNPNGYYCYAPPLNLNTTYYWYIKLTLPPDEVHNSPTWSFLTTTESIFNPQPVAVVPGDQANGIEARMTEFVWNLPDFPVDSFFDVFCDLDPDFPDPPIYSGPGILLDPFPDRWIYIHPLLLPSETYYWYVRYTNMTGHYYTSSGTGTFTTGVYFPPESPILWSPVMADLDLPLDVPLKVRKPVDLPPPDSFFDVFCDIDPAFTAPPIYSGPGIDDPLDPELYIFPLEDLLENQTYHWFVRLTDLATGLSSYSEVRFFTTGNFIQPGIPEFLVPPPDVVIPGVIVHLDAGASYNIGYDVKGLQNYWDFGDAPAPPPNFDNIAVQQGYVAKCTVTDVDGDEATGSISVEVDSDTNPTNWYVLSHYSGLWHPGDPYPSFGYGPRLIYLNPPPGGKGEFYIMFVEGDGLDPTLPVELSSFDAVVTSELFVSLQWVVQSETNLLGYYILRNDTELLNSALILNPSPITEGSALGTQITYHYTDAQVEQGNTYYYWLNSVDLDGTTHFHGPVSVTVTGTDPEEPIPIIPLKTELCSAFPNPFRPRTTIPYNLKAAGDVKIEVYNNKGQLIWRYEEKGKAAGYHSVVWNGTDLSGRAVSSGVYYYHMTCGKYSAGKKAVLLK